MISDQALASNCRRLIKHYDHNENRISVESRVYDGVRYITFIGQPNEAFRKDYSLFRFMHDILGYSIYDESFYNDNFAGDWIAVKGKVVEGIKKDERIPVCFSGYGVGGAVATIAGYDLLRTMPSIISRVVTFGAPRALNSRKTNNGFTYCFKPNHNELRFAQRQVAKNVPLDEILFAE